MRPRQRRTLTERALAADRGAGVADRVAQAGDDTSDSAEAPGQIGRERGVLADAQHGAAGDGPAPVLSGGDSSLELRGAVPVGTAVHTQRHTGSRRLNHRRLASVHRCDPGPRVVVQRRLATEQQLVLEHGARGACDERGRGGMEADTASRPDGKGDRGEHPLEEHERALLPDPTARLVPPRDHGVGSRGLGGERLLQARRDHVCPHLRARERPDGAGEALGCGPGQQHRVKAIGFRGEQLGEELAVVEQRAPATAAVPRQPVHLLKRRATVGNELKVQYANSTGAAARDCDSRISWAGRRHDCEIECGRGNHRHCPVNPSGARAGVKPRVPPLPEGAHRR